MAVERETSQQEISSFASLLKTFLPDHNDLPLMGSTEELLQHVKGSMTENTSAECKPVKGKDEHLIGQSECSDSFEKSASDLLKGVNNIHCSAPHQLANTSHCNTKQYAGNIQKDKPVQLINAINCNASVQVTDVIPCNIPEQLADDSHTSKSLTGNTKCNKAEQHEDNNKSEAAEQPANSSSITLADYDSDATIDVVLNTAESQDSLLTGKENSDKECIISNFSSNSYLPSGKKYACFICDEIFKELSPYAIHMKCHFQITGSIRCNDCGEILGNKTLFLAHRKLSAYEIWTDRSKVSIDPSIDDTEESGDGSPLKKRRKKDGDEIYVCSVCGKSIHKYSSFLKHIRTHKDVLAFSCGVCQERFHAPCLLRYHIDLQHSHVLPFQCKRCLRRFKLKCSLSTHLRYCDVDPCNLPFAEEMQFIDHLSQQRKYQGLEGDNDGMSQYSCPICMLMYDSPEDLKSHMNYHDETKPFKCEQCGRGFRSKHVLRKHASVHETKHECRCEICGVQLLTLSGYNAHLRGHRNQEKIQAKFFPELAAVVKEDIPLSGTALRVLERIKKPETEGDVSQDSTSKGTVNRKLKNYKCPICEMLFFSGGVKFQMHAHKEHKDAVFEKCNLCTKTFIGKDNLEKHVRLHKMFADSYECDECGKIFRRKFAMQVHKKMHTFKKFVKCDICGQEFRFVSEVEKHKNKKHRYDRLINIYKCSICGQRFPMLSHLSVHCYCHNLPDVKPFECDLCKVSYKTSVELKKHIFETHENLMNTLGDASYISDADNAFQAFSGTLASGSDGFKVSLEQIATGRVENITQNNVDDIISSLKPQMHSFEKDESKNNKETTYGDVAKENNKFEELHSEEKTPIEELTLPSNVEAYNLATRQFYHQTKFLKRYTCEVCQKAFSSNSDLKTHRRTHSGETPFKCDFCDRSFKQRGHRKLHIQVVHTKEMPYKCDQCDSAFPTRYRYQIHIKRHTGVREHQCCYCEKGFYTFGKLNEHMKKRHSQEWTREQSEKEEIAE